MSRVYCEGSTLDFVLVGMDVQINILNSVADVTLTQKYDNPHTTPVNCFYSFPIDPSSCVYEMRITTPHEEFRAELKEANVARSEYKEAVERGQTAVLVEQKTQENLVMSIGNINPGEFVSTTVQFFTPLLNEDSNLRFVLPTILSSRYTPSGYVDPYTTPVDAASAKLFDFTIDTKIESSGRISKVECLTYSVDVTQESEGYIFTVKLREQEKVWKGDYILSLVFDNPHETTVVVDHLNSKSAVSVSFNPNFVEPEDIADSSKYDYVFLIDRSGSMSGSRIAQVRDTMVLFLRSLPVDCRFNIIGFGSSFESLFPDTVLYDENNMEKASAFCKKVEADLGGTELLQPLAHIQKKVQVQDRFLNIFVLTDGEVSNTDQVLKAGKSMNETTRIYTFGIGSGVSHELVRGLANSARGTAEFIVEGEELDSKVIRSLSSASKNLLTNITVDWNGLPFELSPAKIENMFDGVRKTFYGLGDSQHLQNRSDKVTIEIKGQVGSRQCSFPFEINFGNRATIPGSIVRQAASVKIRELESSSDEASRVRALALSLETSVMCSQTSFIGVSNKNPEPRPIPKVQYNPMEEEERMHQQNLPLRTLCDSGFDSFGSSPPRYMAKKRGMSFGLPSFRMSRKSSVPSAQPVPQQSGGGFFSRLFSKSPAPVAAAPAPVAAAYVSRSITDADVVNSSFEDDCDESEGAEGGSSIQDSAHPSYGAKPSSSSGIAPSPSPKASPEILLRKITDLQKAAGYWTLTQEICSIIGVDSSAVKAEAQQISVPEDVLITSAVVQFIQTQLSQFKDRWILMVNKSTAWLKKNTPSGSQTKLDEATQKLTTPNATSPTSSSA